MSIEVAALATTVVTSFLLPYVKLGVEKISEGVAGKLGDAAAQHAAGLAQKIWDRVTGVFGSEKDKMALELFRDDPEDLQARMVKVLRQKLEEDPALARELAEWINSPGPDGKSTGAQIMNAGTAGILDARGANFSGAQGVRLAGVMINNTSPRPASDPKRPEEES